MVPVRPEQAGKRGTGVDGADRDEPRWAAIAVHMYGTRLHGLSTVGRSHLEVLEDRQTATTSSSLLTSFNVQSSVSLASLLRESLLPRTLTMENSSRACSGSSKVKPRSSVGVMVIHSFIGATNKLRIVDHCVVPNAERSSSGIQSLVAEGYRVGEGCAHAEARYNASEFAESTSAAPKSSADASTERSVTDFLFFCFYGPLPPSEF